VFGKHLSVDVYEIWETGRLLSQFCKWPGTHSEYYVIIIIIFFNEKLTIAMQEIKVKYKFNNNMDLAINN